MTYHAFTDGASRGNPGESGIGIVVLDEKGAVVLSANGYIGIGTNNKAEYTALITLLKSAGSLPCSTLIIHSDSELMVRQMTGRYKVRDRDLKELFDHARSLMSALPFGITFRHIPREENREADRLANLGIDTRKECIIQ